MKTLKKVNDLPAWAPEVQYSVEALIVKAELDGVALEVKDGNTVVLPWEEEYQPNADFRSIYICAHTFYGAEEKKWIKTSESWVYVSKDITYENVVGGNLGKWWEIRYIILPPFPEVPAYRRTEWAGWEIHGEIWDKKDVSYFRDRWVVRLPLFFREVGTTRELEFLTENKVWFSDQNGSSEYGSDTYLDYFFERISYLADKLGVEDPAIRLKEQEEKKAEAEAEARRAEEELVDVHYVFQELNYYCTKKVEFQIKDGKVHRLYGDRSVMLDVVPFSMEVLVSMTRAEARRPAEVHRVDLGKGYAAIYKPAAGKS